ncbi:MAG: protease modulator HflK, partial [Ignavibacteriales bacterium]
MPWNDNAKPGPWGSPTPNETPPPRGPRRPVPPPQEQRNGWSERFGGWYRGPNGKPRLGAVATLIAGAIGLWLLTGLYIVETGQQAVVTSLGSYNREAGPGLHYHLPWPLESAEAVPTALQRTDVGGTTPETENERLMLTGDGAIADVAFSVVWRVSDARAYLFTLDDGEGTIRTVGEVAMRDAVARTALQPLFSTAKDRVQAETAARMQQVLDGYHAGVRIDAVEIRNTAPPPQTIDAYRERE